MQAKTPRSLLLLSLGALSTAAFAPLLRAAIVMGDSPAVRQAQGALTRGGDVTMDGNTRTGRLATSYAGGDEAERNPLNPGPRDGGVSDLDEPTNPVPAPAKEEGESKGFLGGMSMKTVGFIAGGALLGLALGWFLGFGWLGIGLLVLVGAAAGWGATKLF